MIPHTLRRTQPETPTVPPPPGTGPTPTVSAPRAPAPGDVERLVHQLRQWATGVPDAFFWTAFACEECGLPTAWCACSQREERR